MMTTSIWKKIVASRWLSIKNQLSPAIVRISGRSMTQRAAALVASPARRSMSRPFHASSASVSRLVKMLTAAKPMMP